MNEESNKKNREIHNRNFLGEFEKPKLLLHVCCSVCAIYVVKLLSRDYDVTLFYYNPNIFPFEEYVKRRTDIETYARNFGINFIEVDYEPERWHSFTDILASEKEGGARCDICFNVRLNQVARYAAENEFEWFASTLTVSPHKNSNLINKIGKALASDYGIDYLQSDFKKNDGFKKTMNLAKELDFYRQNYCGCSYSLTGSKHVIKNDLSLNKMVESLEKTIDA